MERNAIALGYRRARAVTKAHAKSFYLASFALFGARRRAAFALYSFCRRLDDLVDDPGDRDGLSSRLAAARRQVSALFAGGGVDERVGLPWHPTELSALRDTLGRYPVPELAFQELINGMEMDLTQTRYQSAAQLDLYCYRVAGVVGLMMAPLLGCTDARGHAHAVDLGKAMQLTNILRDVREDLERGRCYLPVDALAAYGLSPECLEPGDRLRAFVREQVQLARSYYRSAMLGIPYLSGFGSQRMVALMAALYSRILDAIEARGCDVLAGRAYLGTGQKLAIAARTLLTPGWAVPEPRQLRLPVHPERRAAPARWADQVKDPPFTSSAAPQARSREAAPTLDPPRGDSGLGCRPSTTGLKSLRSG